LISKLKSKFGIFTEHTSELVTIEEARKLDEQVVKDFYYQLKKECRDVEELNETMDRAMNQGYFQRQGL